MILKSKNKNFTDIKDLLQQKNIDINKKVVSNKASFSKKVFKYFIGYKDPKNWNFMFISPKNECIWKRLSSTKYIYFLIKDSELLEKYNEIWGKVKNSIKKEFDSELSTMKISKS